MGSTKNNPNAFQHKSQVKAIKTSYKNQINVAFRTLQDELLTCTQVCELVSFNKTTLWKQTKSIHYKRSQVLGAVKPINH